MGGGALTGAGRRFGEEGGVLTYGGYLRLPDLLDQQVPQADPPAHDELLFITDAERLRLERRLAEPTLWDAYVGLLAARGLPAARDQEILESLVMVASDQSSHGDLWWLAEDLITHDEIAGLWRARHVQMVERQIGTKSGTGGSTGAPYLSERVALRCHPLLWELRARL